MDKVQAPEADGSRLSVHSWLDQDRVKMDPKDLQMEMLALGFTY